MDEHDTYVSVGLDGVLASTEKLLATNRGLDFPDQRDSLPNDRFYMPHDLLAERIKIDTGKLRRKAMRYAARHRSLKGLMPFAFDDYANGLLVGNPLSQPLEEINPMQIAEQARRVTKMGSGGVGDPQAITLGMQSVDPTQFGFISPIEGPECFDPETEVFTSRGWVKWPNVTPKDIFACRVNGVLEWHQAERLVAAQYSGILLVGESETIRMAVTPNHRVLNTRDKVYRVDSASDVFGKAIRIPIRHEPFVGDSNMKWFHLPEVATASNAQRKMGPFEIGDWCELLGWWLSEGSKSGPRNAPDQLRIHQCPVANPKHHASIYSLLTRMGLIRSLPEGDAFHIPQKQVVSWFARYTDGCYDKWIPDEFLHAPVVARTRMLDALLSGDGRDTVKRRCYCTVSKRLAESVEQLAIGLGYAAFIRIEKDSRPHVKTTNYVVSLHRQQNRQLLGRGFEDKRSGKPYGANWSQVAHTGKVYCATVPGGLLMVRGKQGTSGFWSGNSERIGVDSRIATGVRVGSDRRLYQRVFDRKMQKTRWVNSEDLRNRIVKIPD